MSSTLVTLAVLGFSLFLLGSWLLKVPVPDQIELPIG